MRKIHELKKHVSVAFAAFALIIFAPTLSAHAQFEVEETEIEKGEAELEVHGAHFSGFPRVMELPEGSFENEVVRNAVGVELGLGLTDWLKVSIEAELEEERGEDGRFGDFELTEVGIGAKVELLEEDDNGVGIAFLVEFEKPIRSETGEIELEGGIGPEAEFEQEKEGETLTFGTAMSTSRGPWSATANLLFQYVFEGEEKEYETANINTDPFELEEVERTQDYWNFLYAAQLKYQITPMIGFGVEAFGEIADIGDEFAAGVVDKHRAGPVLYINLSGEEEGEEDEAENGEEDDERPEVAMAVGVLFGLNDDTSDVAVKWDLEVEF